MSAGDFSGDVDADAAGLGEVIPAGAVFGDGEVLRFDARGDGGGGSGEMGERESGHGAFDELRDELLGADFDELRSAGDEFGFTDGGADSEDPLGAGEAAVVGDGSFEEEFGSGFEGNGEAVGGDDELELIADLVVERGEDDVEGAMVVGGEIAGMGVEREGAEGSGEAGEGEIEFLGVGAFREIEMAENGEARVDGVKEPVGSDVELGEGGLPAGGTAGAHEGRAFFFHDLDEAAQEGHEAGARGDAEARGDELGVVDESAAAGALDAGDGEAGEALGRFGLELEAAVLRAGLDVAFIAAGGFVGNGERGGGEADGSVGGGRVEENVLAVGLAVGDGEIDEEGVESGREVGGDGAGSGRSVGSGHVEGEAVGEESASGEERDGAVLESFVIELASSESVGLEPEIGEREVDGIFEVTALRLEVVRPEVHAFRPHNSREGSHAWLYFTSAPAQAG